MTDINIKSMENKKIGIYAVREKHDSLTKRMNEASRFGRKKILEVDDDEFDPNAPQEDNVGDENPDVDQQGGNESTGIEGGLDVGDDMGNDMGDDMGDDVLDLDALVDDDTQNMGDIPDEQPGMENMGAVDSIDSEPTEEIDVTQFVEKGNELTQKVDSQVQAMSQQINALTQKLTTMDQLLGKIQQVEDEIHAMRPPKPIETLKLRSLDSYPYNQGIDDYWKQKEIEIEKLRDFNRVDNKEYVLTNDDVSNFSDIEIRDSFKVNNSQPKTSFPGPKTNQAQPSRFNRQEHA